MKKTIVLFAIIMASFSSFATILRVNNNPGVTLVPTKVFSSISTAIAAAGINDSIYLEPSDINYGRINISNGNYTIIGPGYLLDKNPITPLDKRTAKIDGLIINTANIRIQGLEIVDSKNNYQDIRISSLVFFVEISNCIFNALTIDNNVTALDLKNNLILSNVGNTSFGISTSTISNNIIFGTLFLGRKSNSVKNNVIMGGSDYLGNFYNNIVYDYSSNPSNFIQTSTLFNNVCVGCTGTPVNNNFFINSSNTLFSIAEPRNFDNLRDDAFILPSTSPAKGKGINGTDCGVFAGATPYILSGIPPFPMLTAYTQGVLSAGNLPITISIKRN